MANQPPVGLQIYKIFGRRNVPLTEVRGRPRESRWFIALYEVSRGNSTRTRRTVRQASFHAAETELLNCVSVAGRLVGVCARVYG